MIGESLARCDTATPMDRWIQKLSADDKEQQDALEELRSILLRGLKAGLSGRAGSDDAFIQDVVQESLIKVLQRLDSYQGRGKFTSWAMAIAFRIAYNELRRKEWKDVSFEELQERQNALPEESTTDPEADDPQQQQSTAELLRCIIEQDLTKKQRDVLLCELNGMPQEEIARQLGTNRNNVYKLFHDGRKSLKRSLEKRGLDKAFFSEFNNQEVES